MIAHLLPYWKHDRNRNRWIRKFWENPDANDQDNTVAFRKRNEQPKMQLRRNECTLKQKLEKKKQMKDETVKYVVARLLPDTWKREAIKQSLDRVHDACFERRYEAMMKEKGLTPSHPKREFKKEYLQPQKLFDYVKVKIALPKEEPVVA